MTKEISSNYSITQLFISKHIRIVADNQVFTLVLKPVRDIVQDVEWNGAYHFFVMDVEEWRKIIPLELPEPFDYLMTMIFDMGAYKQYSHIALTLRRFLEEMIPGLKIDFKNRQLVVDKIIITSEI